MHRSTSVQQISHIIMTNLCSRQCNYDKQTYSPRVISDAMNQPFYWRWRVTRMNLNCGYRAATQLVAYYFFEQLIVRTCCLVNRHVIKQHHSVGKLSLTVYGN